MTKKQDHSPSDSTLKFCSICMAVEKEMHWVEGKVLKVDLLEGESYPDAVKPLVVVPDTLDPDLSDSEYWQCPECGQYYWWYHQWDNDIYNQLDYVTLQKTTADGLQDTIRSVKKRRKELAKRREKDT